MVDSDRTYNLIDLNNKLGLPDTDQHLYPKAVGLAHCFDREDNVRSDLVPELVLLQFLVGLE